MSNRNGTYTVKTLGYTEDTDFYPISVKVVKGKINEIIQELEDKLRQQDYYNVYSYYDGEYWFIESSHDTKDERVYQIEKGKYYD